MKKLKLKLIVIDALIHRGYSKTEAVHILNVITNPSVKESDYGKCGTISIDVYA